MKIKNIFKIANVALLVVATMASCNDFLDREPLSDVTPGQYFNTADQLAAYTITGYSVFPVHAGWSTGTVNEDDETDNMIAGDFNAAYNVKGNWKVPASGANWTFDRIRYCNYFFEQVLPKLEKNSISGATDDIKHYIGEMYFLRAYNYFSKLKTFGDYPIVTEVLPDVKDVLMEKGVRQPRNMVARFILEDLDKAISMLKGQGFMSNNRLNKESALLLKSRVALYEATFEKYHQGTGRVPGDANWPGKRVHPNFTLDVAKEVNFFLDQAISAAEQVADKVTLTPNSGQLNPATDTQISGWNSYFEMFGAVDMKGYSEVLFWKSYLRSGSISISHGTPAFIFSGQNNGMLKTFVESFLMKDGLPWYAASGANPYKGDVTIDNVKTNRDQRLQLFVFGESDKLPSSSLGDGKMTLFTKPLFFQPNSEIRDRTGYRIRKCLNYDPKQIVSGQNQSTTGSIIFRGAEAYLNYIEAYYLKNGRVDGKADAYWKAIRKRAGVDADYTKSINATDYSKETDWAKFSGSEQVDKTLFNIRRERRAEFVGEGLRFDDLTRWRSRDQFITTKFIPEGVNFWDEMYKKYTANELIADGSTSAKMSSPSLSKYVRPYSVVKQNNEVYDGFIWAKANYLSPVPIREMELLSPDEKAETSVLYQNPYWPLEIAGSAIE